jgi:hypothetical protein
MGNNIDHATRLEDILDEWDLDKRYESIDTSSISLPGVSTNDTITVSSSITSPYTFTGSMGTNFPNSVWTTAGTNTTPWMTQSSLSAPKIKLDGEGADVEVNGWSLVDAVKRIEERLGLFQPNPELEKEWSELRELGEQYRNLEQLIRDKQATWDRLKAMPAPEID